MVLVTTCLVEATDSNVDSESVEDVSIEKQLQLSCHQDRVIHHSMQVQCLCIFAAVTYSFNLLAFPVYRCHMSQGRISQKDKDSTDGFIILLVGCVSDSYNYNIVHVSKISVFYLALLCS